jgi:hypothetical protein
MPTRHPEALVHELMMSETLQRLSAMAWECPYDLADPAMRKSALAISSHALMRALDDARIQFTDEDDRAMLYGLLMAVMEVIFEGRFGAQAVKPGQLQ